MSSSSLSTTTRNDSQTNLESDSVPKKASRHDTRRLSTASTASSSSVSRPFSPRQVELQQQRQSRSDEEILLLEKTNAEMMVKIEEQRTLIVGLCAQVKHFQDEATKKEEELTEARKSEEEMKERYDFLRKIYNARIQYNNTSDSSANLTASLTEPSDFETDESVKAEVPPSLPASMDTNICIPPTVSHNDARAESKVIALTRENEVLRERLQLLEEKDTDREKIFRTEMKKAYDEIAVKRIQLEDIKETEEEKGAAFALSVSQSGESTQSAGMPLDGLLSRTTQMVKDLELRLVEVGERVSCGASYSSLRLSSSMLSLSQLEDFEETSEEETELMIRMTSVMEQLLQRNERSITEEEDEVKEDEEKAEGDRDALESEEFCFPFASFASFFVNTTIHDPVTAFFLFLSFFRFSSPLLVRTLTEERDTERKSKQN
uniref:Uncharacterized protein n=1 Tax=Chromera velia CCMP2878 TaxID=1169474 RepID=A0A0G4FKG7_9ALVE|eukprot:Cvel_414.t1-p1 / transcript=Cvel_414.t1 / gene=Cvel_414 / organism=Chromera_velia_CCMP2878 / gene_product=hypothetical protein / transcript_product=hypothetical protein / location=Cvel_scaffold13:139815-141113(-) / protein_length=433 / sequence_SO=supercontig / SO=protein_coding / is_pseudo=false